MIKPLTVFLILFSTGIVAQRTAKLDSLKTALHKGSSIGKCNAALLLSENYSSTNLNTALQYAKESLQFAKQTRNDSLIACSYNSIANIYQYKTVLDSALFFHNEALQHRKKAKNALAVADSYNNIGITYDAMGLFSKSLEYYYKALSCYDKNKDYEKLAMVYTNIGIIYKSQKEYTKAYHYYKKSYDLYQKVKSPFGITVSSGNLGSVLIDFQQYEKSLQYSEIAKKGYRDLGYERYEGYAVSNIAVVYDSLHQFQKANENYLEALRIHQKFENTFEIANISNAYALCLIKQKKFQESIHISNTALRSSVKAKAYLLEVNANKNLSKAHAALGNFDQAYTHSILYNNGMDSLFKAEKTKTIFELETKYETEKKEKLLLLKDKQVQQRNTVVIILGILVFSAVLIGYLIIRQQKLKNKQQEQEFQLQSAIALIETQNKLQEQRLRISRDLHDNIGAQLTFIISSVDNVKYVFDLENTKLDKKLQGISNFTKATIIELRDTIWAMNNDAISFDDLKMRIFNFMEKAKTAKEAIDFTFDIDTTLAEAQFSSIKGMNLYRVVQESIHNSIKYAEATSIRTEVKNLGSDIQITVSDNGIGFDAAELGSGNGLQNIKKRIKEIDGTFQLQSEQSKGTRLIFTVPK